MTLDQRQAEVRIPATEREVAEALNPEGISPFAGLILSKLAFERDKAAKSEWSQRTIYAWLGFHRGAMRQETVDEIQRLLGPLQT